MLKKIFCLFLVLAVFSCLLCNVFASEKQFSVVTGLLGGTMYPVSGAWANAVNTTVPGINITNQVGGGNIYCARILSNKEAEFALFANDTAYYLYNGKGVFEGKPLPEVRAITGLFTESFHAITLKSSSIYKIEDLIGKKTGIGPTGSGTLLTSQRVLEAYKLTEKQIGAKKLGFNEAADYLRDGHVDAIFYTTGLPFAPVLDVNATKPVRIIGINEEAIEKLKEKYPFYIPTTVPIDAYKGIMERPIRTISVRMLLLTRSDIDEDTVYKVTKAFFENIERIKMSHACMSNFVIKNAIEGIPIPLHSGAERYYKEIGIIK